MAGSAWMDCVNAWQCGHVGDMKITANTFPRYSDRCFSFPSGSLKVRSSAGRGTWAANRETERSPDAIRESENFDISLRFYRTRAGFRSYWTVVVVLVWRVKRLVTRATSLRGSSRCCGLKWRRDQRK